MAWPLRLIIMTATALPNSLMDLLGYAALFLPPSDLWQLAK